MEKISIFLNGEEKEFSSPLTIQMVLETLQIPPQGRAVEVNRKIIPRREHGSYFLKPGDRMEIVHPVGGG